MKIAVFSTKAYDEKYLTAANAGRHELVFFEERLTLHSAGFAKGFEAVCIFINDNADAAVLRALHEGGTRLLALRSAGFNHADLKTAGELGIKVCRVPAYSPHAVAEFALGLILTLNRKYHRAYNRVREGNFSIEGLIGFDLHGRTAGLIGTGKIGYLLGRALKGLGCDVIGFDPFQSTAFQEIGRYVSRDELLATSDIVSLHCPLTPESYHIIGEQTLAQMKDGVMLINTSRGGLIDAVAVTEALKTGKVGYLGLDVYEQEADFFFENLSETIIRDDVLQRLLMFPNVMITSHQAFFTETAMRNICETTLLNVSSFEEGHPLSNEVRYESAFGKNPK